MSDPDPDLSSGPAAPAETSEKLSLPLWKKALVGLAAVMVAVGIALGGLGGGADAPGGTGTGATPTEGAGSGASGLAPNSLVGGSGQPGATGDHAGTDGAATGAEPTGASGYSPFFLKGGLSFLLAFSVGYALRTFLRMTLVVLGVLTLVVVGLSNLEWITIHWQTIQGFWDNHSPDFSSQFQSFQAFVTGSLPAAGLGGTGLWAGFKQA